MRGVQGEEYPIGRELFNQTYRMGEALATPPPEPLSPAAQAVSDAYETTYTETGLIAAIRELADQVVPHPGRYPMSEYMEGIRNAKHDVRREILAIATELENQP
jgi:hypothetical protein